MEVELQIFGQLSAADLAACAATCRAWRASASAPSLWAAVCQRRWPHGWPGAGEDGGAEGLPALDALHAGGQWREMYGLRRQVGWQCG